MSSSLQRQGDTCGPISGRLETDWPTSPSGRLNARPRTRQGANASPLWLRKTKRLVSTGHHAGTMGGFDRSQIPDLLFRQPVHKHARSLLYQDIGDVDVLIWRYANSFHGDRRWTSCPSHFASTGGWGRGGVAARSTAGSGARRSGLVIPRSAGGSSGTGPLIATRVPMSRTGPPCRERGPGFGRC